MTTEKSKQFKSRMTLILLFVVFLAPGIGAWVLYKFTDLGRDGGSASKGELIQPPRTLDNVQLLDPLKPEEQIYLQKRWSLAYLTEENCNKTCVGNIYRMRQIRLAIGKHYDRVKRILIVKTISDQAQLEVSLKDYHGQLILESKDVSPEFINAFKVEGIEDAFTGGRLYIIDPLGNLMMSYSPDQNPSDIIKDLVKIFRVSQL